MTMPDGIFCRHLSFDNVTGDDHAKAPSSAAPTNRRSHANRDRLLGQHDRRGSAWLGGRIWTAGPFAGWPCSVAAELLSRIDFHPSTAAQRLLSAAARAIRSTPGKDQMRTIRPCLLAGTAGRCAPPLRPRRRQRRGPRRRPAGLHARCDAALHRHSFPTWPRLTACMKAKRAQLSAGMPRRHGAAAVGTAAARAGRHTIIIAITTRID